MKKIIGLLMALDFNGHYMDDFEGIKNSKVINTVTFEDTEYGYGYDDVEAEYDKLEDISYVDKEHQRWYIESVWHCGNIVVPNTWSTEKQDEVAFVEPQGWE